MLIKHLPITKTHFCESTVCRTSLFNKQQTYKISISSCIMFKTRMKFMLIFRAELYNYKTYCRLCTVVSFRFTPFVQLTCAWYIHVQMRFVCKWFTTMSNLQFHKHMHTHTLGENGVKNSPWSFEREKNWFSGQVEKMIVCVLRSACTNNAANDMANDGKDVMMTIV